ncbi:MAG: hypothetical protein EA358_10590 [Flavobacteriales bacterium]|nr:MAG: hypothetical protein EA358_10590 [Flavobacteriales bacterium]
MISIKIDAEWILAERDFLEWTLRLFVWAMWGVMPGGSLFKKVCQGSHRFNLYGMCILNSDDAKICTVISRFSGDCNLDKT